MNLLIIVALTVSAFLGTPVLADTCKELKAQYAELRRVEDGYISRMLPPTGESSANQTLWPITEAELQQYRPFGDAFCRPEVYDREKSNYGGWYRPEWHIAMGQLCNTTIGPVKLIRAAMHCEQQDRHKLSDCCTLSSDASHEQNGNATVAQQNICEKLKVIVERTSGAEGTEMASKCGQDAMETLKQAHQELRASYCSKP